jgi:hypothetical protein
MDTLFEMLFFECFEYFLFGDFRYHHHHLLQLLGNMDLVMRGLVTDRVFQLSQSLQPGIHKVRKKNK